MFRWNMAEFAFSIRMKLIETEFQSNTARETIYRRRYVESEKSPVLMLHGLG